MADPDKLAKLAEGRARAQREREERARAVLGEHATQEQIEAWVKRALSEQKQATRMQNMAKKMQKSANATTQQALAAATGTATLPPPMAAPAPQHYPPTPEAAKPRVHEAVESLQEHPIFGAAVRSAAPATVEIERIASPRPEHNAPGVTPGYLEEVDFSIFSKQYVQQRHGGGNYKAIAKDSAGRQISTATFPLSGHAKPAFFDEDLGFQAGGFQRVSGGRAFQPEPSFEVPEYLRRQQEEDRARLERLELILTKEKPAELSAEQRFELWKKEQEVKQAQEDARRRQEREDEDRRRREREQDEEKRHERRMQELKAQMEAEATRERERNQQMIALLTKQPAADPAAHIAPLITAMTGLVAAKDTQMQGLFGLMKGVMKGEESPRTWKDRLVDLAEDGLKSAFDAGIFDTLMKRWAAPKTPPPKEPTIPSGSAFRLPDGRVVPPEVCADFLARYRHKFGQDPTLEVCAQQLTRYMDAAAAVEAQQAPPPAIPGPLPVQQPALPSREKAEEMVLAAGQRAAAEVTQRGGTPEQAAQAARAASNVEAQRLNALYAAAQGKTNPPSPTSPSPTPGAAAPPPPAPAAVAAARAAQAQPATPPPAPASDVVTVPWMSKSFPTDLVDAFQAGQDPVDFLERSMRIGKISKDAIVGIGKIYDDSDEKEPIEDTFMKVKAALDERGIEIPLQALVAFKAADHGAIWIETLLFACSFGGDMAAARKAIAEAPEE